MASGLKMRHPPPSAATIRPAPTQDLDRKPAPAGPADAHPSGHEKNGTWTQVLRMLLFFVYFNGGCIA
jgi:lysocardiolipin and lysophospholipid acyltransferase